MKKFEIFLKEHLEDRWYVLMNETLTNLVLEHTPDYKTDGSVVLNIFKLSYVCNLSNTTCDLTPLIETKSFKEFFPEISNYDVNYLSRHGVTVVTERVITFMLNKCVVENTSMILNSFRTYKFPVTQIIEKLSDHSK